MKKTMWSPNKSHVLLKIIFLDRNFRGNNKNKLKRRKILQMKMRQSKPENGYGRYTVRRSKPFHTFDSEEIVEENEYFWKDMARYSFKEEEKLIKLIKRSK